MRTEPGQPIHSECNETLSHSFNLEVRAKQNGSDTSPKLHDLFEPDNPDLATPGTCAEVISTNKPELAEFCSLPSNEDISKAPQMFSGTVTDFIPYIPHTYTVTQIVAREVTESSQRDPLESRAPLVVEVNSRSTSVLFVGGEDYVPASATPITDALKDVERNSQSDDSIVVANVVNDIMTSQYLHHRFPSIHFYLHAA